MTLPHISPSAGTTLPRHHTLLGKGLLRTLRKGSQQSPKGSATVHAVFCPYRNTRKRKPF
ncbi:rCG52206, partial [Rattus norvegicus]